MVCQAVINGEVKTKAKASLKLCVDGKLQYYCVGYIDSNTEYFIKTCLECKKNIIYAGMFKG